MDRVRLRAQCSLMHEWMDGFKSVNLAKLQTVAPKVCKHLEFAEGLEIIGMRRGEAEFREHVRGLGKRIMAYRHIISAHDHPRLCLNQVGCQDGKLGKIPVT